MADLYDLARRHEVRTVTDTQLAAQTDKDLLATPPQRRDQAGTAENDPDAEYVLAGIEFSAVAAGTLKLHTDAAGAGQIGNIWQFAANFNSGFIPCWKKCGRNKGLKYASTGTNPNVSLTLHYIVKRYGASKPKP